MAILIEGMEMPKVGGKIITSYADGRVLYDGGYIKAVPVPPHGRLIDADALCASHKEVCSRSMKFNLDLAQTVIPASEDG